MKAKLNSKSKRTIIIIAIILLLAIVAGVSTYFYVKSNDMVDAVGENTDKDEIDVPGNSEENNKDNSSDNVSSDSTDQVGTDEENGNKNQTQENNGTTESTEQSNNGTNNSESTENSTQTESTESTTQTETDATIVYEEVTENIIVEEPWETHKVEWTPEKLNISTTNVEINERKLKVNKQAVTSSGYNTVSAGDTITYILTVKNDNNENINSLYIEDIIPEGTELVSIENNGKVIENKVIWDLWNLGLEPGESISVSFVVKVTEEAQGTIVNTANVDETPSEETTENPVLNSTKTGIVTRGEEKEEVTDYVKTGDEITYTISVENTGDVDGTTIIKDADLEDIFEEVEIDENTKQPKATLLGEIKVYENEVEIATIEKEQLVSGYEVNVPAKGTINIVFTIKVNIIRGSILNTAIVGGNPTETDEKPTIDWSIEKNSTLEELNGNIEDGKAEKGDKIHYSVNVTNNSSIDLENLNIIDQMLNIDTYVSIKAGETQTVISEAYEVQQADIDKQETIFNTVTSKYEDDEKDDTDDGTEVVEKEERVEVVKNSELVKADGNTVEGKAEVGDTIKYSVTVTNKGNVTLRCKIRNRKQSRNS